MSEVDVTIIPHRPLINTAYIERIYPVLCGICMCLFWLKAGREMLECFKLAGWKWTNVYGAIFNLVAIITGFLGAYYGIIQARQSRTLQRLGSNEILGWLASYIRKALYHGFLLCLVTLPFLLAEPNIPIGRFMHLMLSIWVGYTSFVLMAFHRAMRSFMLLMTG